jgi:hypothetical protein
MIDVRQSLSPPCDWSASRPPDLPQR